MRIGILSDTHIGRCVPRAIGELRRMAYRHAFSEAIDVFIREKISCLIHAGDVFEKRSMTPRDSVFVKEELQRLVDSIREEGGEVMIYAVRGNHDGSMESSALDYIKHPLAKYLKVIGDDTLRGKGEAQVYDGLRVMGVSYHPYIARKFKKLKPIIRKNFSMANGMNVLILHNFIEGYHQIPPGVPKHNVLDISDLKGLGADLIVVGHYHEKMEPMRKDGMTLISPGSTEAIDLSDEGPHGVYILDGRSIRFVPIKPLHEIRNMKVVSMEEVKPASWFIGEALKGAQSYASTLRLTGREGVLRLVLSGLTDGDPHTIDRSLALRLAELRGSFPELLHVELVNRAQNVHRRVSFPPIGGGLEFAYEVVKSLGDPAREAVRIIEEVYNALDERASQRTGLLTSSDRAPFLRRWVKVLERMEVREG